MSELNNNQFELNEEQVQQVAGGSIDPFHRNDTYVLFTCTNPDCRRHNNVEFCSHDSTSQRIQCKYCTYQYTVRGKRLFDQNGNPARISRWDVR